MSGGKGGSQTSQVEIPEWIEDPSKRNIERAEQAQQLGYQPYYGPDVAAFNPTQQHSFDATTRSAQAFGLIPQGNLGMGRGTPQAENFGGMQAHSSGGLYDQAIAELRDRAPGTAHAYNAMFIDPQTGAAPTLGVTDAQLAAQATPEGGEGEATGAVNQGPTLSMGEFLSSEESQGYIDASDDGSITSAYGLYLTDKGEN